MVNDDERDTSEREALIRESMGGVSWYDRAGKQITMDEASRLMGDMRYKVVRRTHYHQGTVSTVWLGLNHSFSFRPDSPPIIFETMVFVAHKTKTRFFGREREFNMAVDEHSRRYPTEQTAIDGHAEVCAEVVERGWEFKHEADLLNGGDWDE